MSSKGALTFGKYRKCTRLTVFSKIRYTGFYIADTLNRSDHPHQSLRASCCRLGFYRSTLSHRRQECREMVLVRGYVWQHWYDFWDRGPHAPPPTTWCLQQFLLQNVCPATPARDPVPHRYSVQETFRENGYGGACEHGLCILGIDTRCDNRVLFLKMQERTRDERFFSLVLRARAETI